jgi:hypothetical protein
MKPSSFPSKTTPWRVMVPRRFSADRKRKARYFKTKEAAEVFCCKIKKFGAHADPVLLIGYKYADLWQYIEDYFSGSADQVLAILEAYRKNYLGGIPKA